MKVCPRCQERIVSSITNTDGEHECHSGNPVLDQEDIFNIGGTSTDYEGTSTDTNVSMLRGIANTVFGTRADVEGTRVSNYTERGVNAQMFRQRQHLEEMDFKDKSNFLKRSD